MAKKFFSTIIRFTEILGAEIVAKKLIQKSGEIVTERIFKDKRAILTVVIENIAPNNTELKRRLKEAKDPRSKRSEDKIVNLLIKIPEDKLEDTLKKLNNLSDEEFDDVLEILDNNLISQFFERLVVKVIDSVPKLKELDEKMAGNAASTLTKLDDLVNKTGTWAGIITKDKKRVILFTVIENISPDNGNLKIWLKEAKDPKSEISEDKMVNILCKIPEDKLESTLKKLNSLDKNGFYRVLDILDI